MYVIGITGGTGAGKTVALNSLKELGALALDCDKIYHDLLLNNVKMRAEIELSFNDVTTDGVIDRKKLSKIVWKEPSALLKLNEITHKYVTTEINSKVDSFEKKGGKLVAIDAVALIESGLKKNCDVVVGILAPAEYRKVRIINRDGLTESQALARINAQQPDSYYKKNCDYIIENNYKTVVEFEEKCKKYFSNLIGGR